MQNTPVPAQPLLEVVATTGLITRSLLSDPQSMLSRLSLKYSNNDELLAGCSAHIPARILPSELLLAPVSQERAPELVTLTWYTVNVAYRSAIG